MTQETPASSENWLQELRIAKSVDEKWVKRSKRIVERYRDERKETKSSSKRCNILWSNIQTLAPMLFGKTPVAQVERRFRDQDPIGRTAAQIIERALQYELDTDGDFTNVVKSVVLDRLLPGRGTAWVRLETTEIKKANGETTQESKACVDYVYWEDFRCSPSRYWDEVTWVARLVYMGNGEGQQRFGNDFKDVPLTHEPAAISENMEKNGADTSRLKRAKVWEIWDKKTGKVYWVAEGYEKILDEKEDPYGLDGFWPCPKPIFSTQTTDTLVPVPDFSQYQDQAEEIDNLTNRIDLLVQALKVTGVYDASQVGVQRMLSEGVDNTLIPVDSWAAMSEKGGIKGVVDWLPMDMVVSVLQQCYISRNQAKQVIYEVTGLSDIIRGSSVASETATAQEIKGKFAGIRLRAPQYDVAVFVSELLRIKAQIMSDFYPAQQLVDMSGIMQTQDAKYVGQAIQLLKTEPMRNFRIEVASDSLVELDEQSERESRIQFLQAAGGFIKQAAEVVQQFPQVSQLVAEMLLFGVRSFKSGRQLESLFENAVANMQSAQQQAPTQQDAAANEEQTAAAASMQVEQLKEQALLNLEAMKQQAETERVRFSATLDAQTRLQIAAMELKNRKEEENEPENASA